MSSAALRLSTPSSLFSAADPSLSPSRSSRSSSGSVSGIGSGFGRFLWGRVANNPHPSNPLAVLSFLFPTCPSPPLPPCLPVSFLRAASTVGAAAAASKVLGLTREMVLAAAFGVGPVMTAFRCAQVPSGVLWRAQAGSGGLRLAQVLAAAFGVGPVMTTFRCLQVPSGAFRWAQVPSGALRWAQVPSGACRRQVPIRCFLRCRKPQILVFSSLTLPSLPSLFTLSSPLPSPPFPLPPFPSYASLIPTFCLSLLGANLIVFRLSPSNLTDVSRRPSKAAEKDAEKGAERSDQNAAREQQELLVLVSALVALASIVAAVLIFLCARPIIDLLAPGCGGVWQGVVVCGSVSVSPLGNHVLAVSSVFLSHLRSPPISPISFGISPSSLQPFFPSSSPRKRSISSGIIRPDSPRRHLTGKSTHTATKQYNSRFDFSQVLLTGALALQAIHQQWHHSP
ncbi:unnamed protein product [Closterium sp. NIES-54]